MLKLKSEGQVLHVTLDRPDVRNAFNDELIAALTATFSQLDRSIRAVVLSGEGKSFCAGGDLQWMKKAAAYKEEENEADALKLAGLFQSIVTCRAAVIAKVHGAAFGGGCGLVASADVAVAQAGTLFAFSEVRLGLIPGTISTVVIPKIGSGNARAYFSTGEAFDADVALRIGLVHDVCQEEQMESVVAAKLKAILSAGPEAVYQSKMLAQEFGLSIPETAKRLARTRASEEGKEGVAAFLEKRKATFVADS